MALRVSTGIRAPAHHVQFILKKQPGRLAEAAIGDSAEATSAGVLGLAVVPEVNANICSSYVHVTHANAAAVKVAVLEEVYYRFRENEGDIEAVCLGDRRDGGRLNGAEGSAGGGRGGRGVKVRVVVL